MSASRASDMLIAIWSFCEPEDREAFVSYLAISGYLANSSSATGTNMEPDDVDRSAERASSAVEVGAPVSPEGAAEIPAGSHGQRHELVAGPVDRQAKAPVNPGAVASASETNSPSDDDAFSEVKGAARPENAAGVEPSSSDNPSAATPAEAAAESQAPRPSAAAEISSSEAPPPPGVTEKAEAAPPPAVSAALHCSAVQAGADGHQSIPTPDALAAGQGVVPGNNAKSEDAVSNFINPRCQHPGTCPFANSREACHDCLMAWSKRPKDEQVRLWAEANEAARASA